MFDPWIVSRPGAELARFKSGLHDFGLETGTIACAPFEEIHRPLWVSGRTEDREAILAHVERSARLAHDLGSRTLAVLVASSGDDQTRPSQLANAREALNDAADIAERYQVVLGIEPLVALPGMLLRSAYEAAELIELVNRPSVRLIFDTGHVASMDGSVLDVQRALEGLVCVYQLADMPGRTEPGAGNLDFPALLARLIGSDYRGLVELEHGWSENSAATEAAGIRLLESIDAQARHRAAG